MLKNTESRLTSTLVSALRLKEVTATFDDGVEGSVSESLQDTIEVINKDENNLVAIEDMFDDMNITLHNSSCLLYGKPVSDKTIENIVSAMKGAILLSIQEEKERELQNKSKDK